MAKAALEVADVVIPKAHEIRAQAGEPAIEPGLTADLTLEREEAHGLDGPVLVDPQDDIERFALDGQTRLPACVAAAREAASRLP